jgi:hypothetical protein
MALSKSRFTLAARELVCASISSSLSAWIFVVRPPRERPIACSCSPFSAARRVMPLTMGNLMEMMG